MKNTKMTKLSDQEALDLDGPLTFKEISNSLYNMKHGKSPGISGFSAEFFKVFWRQIGIFVLRSLNLGYNKNSAEGAKVTGATIRMWLLNKFISFLAVLTWKTGLKTNVDKVPSGAHIFQASPIPSNGYIFSTDFLYHTAQ